MKNIVKRIKEKKELSDLSDELVEEELASYARKHGLNLTLLNKKEWSIVTKEIRNTLRKYTGRFKASDKKRFDLLDEGRINELLKTHSSTKERLKDYSKLISLIKKINPKSILDIGCGLNPIAIASKFPETHYHALDIKEQELKLVEHYFAKHNLNGDVHLADIRKVKKFPKTDLCLILKTLDIIDANSNSHKNATEIIKKLKKTSRNIIVSFSTRTLSGKPMSNVRRLWFERLCASQKLSFKTLTTTNEIFYVIKI